MNKKLVFFFLILLGVSSAWFSIGLFKKTPASKLAHHIKWSQGPYFFPITISKFTAANQPCLVAQINQKPVSLMIDLGFRGQFGFSSTFLQSIENKTYVRSTKMYGIRGSEHQENIFKLPKISVGPISFSEPEIHEYSEAFRIDSNLFKETDQLSPAEPGKLGWELFGNTNLFLDLKHSKIAFCDSLSTLKKQGYTTEKFIKASLLLERGLVEFEAKTSQGNLRCMLDTGATWNILNTQFNKQKAEDPSGIVPFKKFKISSNDFGPLQFHLVPIQMPIPIEAILGMEFFEEHYVFLDFSENSVYFCKSCYEKK